jgi:hypothetical protein
MKPNENVDKDEREFDFQQVDSFVLLTMRDSIQRQLIELPFSNLSDRANFESILSKITNILGQREISSGKK